MTQNLTTFDAALKELYDDQKLMNLTYRKHPLLAMLPKKENTVGRNYPMPLIYSNPQGRSRDFSIAQARSLASQSSIESFLLTRVKDYSIATIDSETYLASQSSVGAFLSAMSVEVDGAINQASTNTAISLYRDQSGAIGQVSAEPSENVGSFAVTLANINEITNFEIGQQHVIWSAKSGGTQRISETGVNTFVVTAVNRSSGVVTYGTTYDSNGTIAANDYIFNNGDRGISMAGLESWLPKTAPTSGDSFFGVDRSSDVTRMAGQRLDITGQAIEEGLVEGANIVGREGGTLDYYFMPYSKYTDLVNSLGSKVRYHHYKDEKAKVGFEGVEIIGDTGPIVCLPDRDCPSDSIFGLQMDTWKLVSIGKFIRPLNLDGNMVLRQTSNDGIEVRYGGFSNLGCHAPGYNINLTV